MLPAPQRLRKGQDFQHVYSRGKTLRTTFFLIRSVPNKLPTNRFGVVVSNKVIKKAVARNRKKRQIRAALAALAPKLISGYDVIIVAQPECTTTTYQKIHQDLTRGFKKIKFLS